MRRPGLRCSPPVFDAPSSAVDARIWAEVYGDDYPAELEPYSFTTRSELRRIVADLGLAPGDLLVDVAADEEALACGSPRQSGASLLGVDISPTALDAARNRAAALKEIARVWRLVDAS